MNNYLLISISYILQGGGILMRQTLFLPRGQKRPGRSGFSGLRLYWGMKAGWGCSLWCPRNLPTFHPANCHRHFEMTRATAALWPGRVRPPGRRSSAPVSAYKILALTARGLRAGGGIVEKRLCMCQLVSHLPDGCHANVSVSF